MSFDSDVAPALDSFMIEGLISEVLYEVKSGKEATVFCCRGGDVIDKELVAAKVYRDLSSRQFKNDAIYQTGRMQFAHNTRIHRALKNKSEFGRKVQYSLWLYHEWQTLIQMYEAGVDCPAPIAQNDRAILMPFVGDEETAAPSLREIELTRDVVENILEQLFDNIERMLDAHCVHGDLSPYNILYWCDRITIIDFPQAIDPRLNPAGRQLLFRDVENLCQWAAKHGVQRCAMEIAEDLWSRFVIGEIG